MAFYHMVASEEIMMAARGPLYGTPSPHHICEMWMSNFEDVFKLSRGEKIATYELESPHLRSMREGLEWH